MSKFPESHLWAIIRGYLVSTADTFDKGLETMVFPAERGKEIRMVEGLYRTYIKGADFGNPLEHLTRHYETVEEAIQGHKEVCRLVKDMTKGSK